MKKIVAVAITTGALSIFADSAIANEHHHPNIEALYANCIVCCMADSNRPGDLRERRSECSTICADAVRVISEGWSVLRRQIQELLR